MGMVRKSATLLLGTSFVASMMIAGAASAQEAVSEQQEDAASSEVGGAIVVTGSRVIQNGNNSPSPVTVVATEDLKAIQPGASLSDALDIIPAFSGSRGSSSNPSSTGAIGAGNGSANQLNLRNLGPERTLVLMDGRRLAPTVFSGIVDVDMIPEMLVQRVDVVTGGVSAVYGSDAVSGVVNYVIDKGFNGLKADASFGISEYGDAETFSAGAAFGTDIGRVHFEASYQFRKEEGVLYRSDRPWINLAGVTGAGTVANPYVNGVDLRQKDYPFGGLITNSVLAGQTFKVDGVLSPFVAGTPTGTNAVQIGGDGGYWDSSLIQPSQGHQIFARLDYEVSSGVDAYAQVAGNLKTDTNYADYLRFDNVTISVDNAFLAPEYQQALQDAGQDTFRLREIMGNGPRNSARSKSDQWMFRAGLVGAIGEFDWNLDYMYGRSELNTVVRHTLNYEKLAMALDAVRVGNAIVCNITITNPGRADDCIPLNLFGPTAADSDAIDYVAGDVHFDAVTTMHDINVGVGGRLFDTWAGAVNAAISGEWRKMAFESESNSTIDTLVDCTGIRYNCTPGAEAWYASFFSSPVISEQVYEGAVEVDVPLLADSAIARSLNVNGAVRYTNYEHSGTYWTWKLGLDWHLTDSLRFRGTRSRDIRAPSLYDLMQPLSTQMVQVTDLLTGVTPVVNSLRGPNPDLKAEIASTWTGGIVWTPVPEFSVALDGYHITIRDAVFNVQGYAPEIQQACYDSGGTSPYCELQIRPGGINDTSPANTATGWRVGPINIGEIETYGADLELNYRNTLFDRPFAVRVLAAYQPHIYFRQDTVETTDQAGAAFGPRGTAATPTVRVTGMVRFDPVENLTVNIMQRWHNGMKLSGVPSEVWVNNHLDSFATTNITLTYKADIGSSEVEFYGGVSNLFDAKPSTGGYTANGTRAGWRDGYPVGDDVRGRFYTAGVRMKL